jgi:hypothetical protein
MIWPPAGSNFRGKASPLPPAPRVSSQPSDLLVRTLSAGARETGELAFTAKLVAAPATETVHAQAPAVDAPRGNRALPGPTPASEPANSEPSEPSTFTKPGTQSQPPPAPVSLRQAATRRTGEPAAPEDREAGGTLAALHAPQHPQHATVQAHPSMQRAAERPGPTEATRPATSPAEPAASKSIATAPAREIRLEVAGGERRVEIRLTDQAGELKVAVHTPDHHLAERLREGLPALSSRLEESGLRAETWQPAAATGEPGTVAETFTGFNHGSQDEQQPGRQGREPQHHHEGRRPRVPEENEQPKEKGKDFEWFLSATQ